MLDESYILQYTREVIEDMSDDKRAIFEGPLRRFVTSTTQNWTTGYVMFHLYQDHFLQVVERWPWLLCNNLGAHLERCYSGFNSREEDWPWNKKPTFTVKGRTP